MVVPFGSVAGDSKSDALRLNFSQRSKLEFHCAKPVLQVRSIIFQLAEVAVSGGLWEDDARSHRRAPTRRAPAVTSPDHPDRLA